MMTTMQALSFAFFHHIFLRSLLDPCLKSDAMHSRSTHVSVAQTQKHRLRTEATTIR